MVSKLGICCCSSNMRQAIEWTLFTFAYILIALRVWARLARQQQKHIITSDAFLIVSALVCLGLIVCDTLTYILGAMKPETAGADMVTADALEKQVALDKVSLCHHPPQNGPPLE